MEAVAPCSLMCKMSKQICANVQFWASNAVIFFYKGNECNVFNVTGSHTCLNKLVHSKAGLSSTSPVLESKHSGTSVGAPQP